MTRIVGADLFAYALPLRGFGGSLRAGWLVRLHDEQGRSGWGDVACWPGFGSSRGERAEVGVSPRGSAGAGAQLTAKALRRVVRGQALLGRRLDSVRDVEGWGLPRNAFPEASHGIECAALGLLAQAQGVSLARLLGGEPAEQVTVHALVHDAASARAALRAGVEYLKLKVGGASLKDDVALVHTVREAAPGCLLRLDANGAWASVAQAREALAAFGHQRLDWIEQPLPAGELRGLGRLRDETGVRVAVDEGLSEERLGEVAAVADAIVIKPMFQGGLLAAATLARKARDRGLEVCVTHALESAVGRTAALHLAAALGEVSACGLTDPLAEDLVRTPRPRGGRLSVPAGPGLGLHGVSDPVGSAGSVLAGAPPFLPPLPALARVVPNPGRCNA